MDNRILVSIILPVYNGEQYLSKSIESCLKQTYKNIELIIVNDFSTDKSAEIIDSFAKLDNRIKVVTNIENQRLPRSLNIGHKAASGDYISWTSDDNIYECNAIELMIQYLEESQSDFVYADFVQIDESENEIKKFLLEEPEELIWRNVVGACFLYKKEVFEFNKRYNSELEMVEDYDFWLRTFLKFKMFHIGEILYKYRVHGSSLTSHIKDTNSELKSKFTKNKLKMFEEIFTANDYPVALKKLIIEFQKSHQIDHLQISNNYNDLINFFKSLEKDNFKNHLFYLKERYILGVRSTSESQTFLTFLNLIILFNPVLRINDYKTAIKILSHKLLKL